jgi:hypothetical protein
MYERFSAWAKVADNTDPALPGVDFDNTLSFTISGDMTLSFPVSGNIMMDCGTDGIKGGLVYLATYVDPFYGDYTEVVLSPDHMRNVVDTEMFLTSSLVSVSVSGATLFDNNDPLLPDVIWKDEVTFQVAGDWTTVFIADNTENIQCNCDTDGSPYFVLYSSEHKSIPCDYTIINYRDGLPVTANITSVSVNTT